VHVRRNSRRIARRFSSGFRTRPLELRRAIASAINTSSPTGSVALDSRGKSPAVRKTSVII